MRALLLVMALTGTAYADDGKRGGRPRPPPAGVALGKPTVTGQLPIDIVRRYIYRNQIKLQFCYEHQLRTKPTLGGTVTAKFEIGGDGIVTTASANGVDPEVSNCFAAVIKRIAFPKPKDEQPVGVRFPFTLNP
jgi:hypothetical protein